MSETELVMREVANRRELPKTALLWGFEGELEKGVQRFAQRFGRRPVRGWRWGKTWYLEVAGNDGMDGLDETLPGTA